MGLEKGKIYKKKKSMKKDTTTVHGHIARAKRKIKSAVFGKGPLTKKKPTASNYISPAEYKKRLEEAGDI